MENKKSSEKISNRLARTFIIAIIVFLILPLQFAIADSAGPREGQATLFYGDGCPHCAKVEDYLKKHNLENSVQEKEIYHNPQNAQEFNQICEEKRIDLMDRGVPFLYTDNGECLVGDSQIISYFENKTGNAADNGRAVKKQAGDLTILMLIGAALVDAINPCAFAVLLILMATILASGNKKRALFSGLAFSASIFISYFLMGLGLYSVIASIKTAQLFIKIIAALAIILGLFNLKDFFWYGKGFLMEVPLSWRPKLKKIISAKYCFDKNDDETDFAKKIMAIKCKKFCFIHPNARKSAKPFWARKLCFLSKHFFKIKKYLKR